MTSGRPGQVFMICSTRSKASLAFVLELEGAVAGADGDGQAVDAGALPEVGGLLGVGEELVHVLLVFLGVEADDVFFDAAELAQFGLDGHAGGVGDVDGFRR